MTQDITITWISGHCPVQSEGFIGETPYYFRARGQRWALQIGRDVKPDDIWHYEEAYGEEQFAAGWMELEEARAFIAKAAALFESGHPGNTPGAAK